MKSFLKSKTIWLAVLQGIAGVVTVSITQYPTVGELLVLKSVLDIAVRFMTTEGIQ